MALKVLSIVMFAINISAILFMLISMCISMAGVNFMGMAHMIILIVLVAIDIAYIVFSLIIRTVGSRR